MTGANWVWWGGAAVVGAAALVGFVWSLVGDRSRGRRRCPRCWYGMDGVPSVRVDELARGVFVCPECGGEAVGEMRLLRTRRRSRCAMVSGVLMLCAVSAGAWPSVRQRGPLSLVPTWALVRIAPTNAQSHWRDASGNWVEHPVSIELRRRVDAEGIADLNWNIILRRCDLISNRKKWPKDHLYAIGLSTPGWAGLCEITLKPRVRGWVPAGAGSLFPEHCGNAVEWKIERESYQELGSLDATMRHVDFDVDVTQVRSESWLAPGRKESQWHGFISIPVEPVATLNECLAPVREGSVDRGIVERISLGEYDLSVRVPEAPGHVVTVWTTLAPPARHPRMAFSGELQLLRDGKVQWRGAMHPRHWDRMEVGGLKDTWELGGSLRNASAESFGEEERSHWTVRIVGNGDEALRNFRATEYWAGQFEVPLTQLVQQQK